MSTICCVMYKAFSPLKYHVNLHFSPKLIGKSLTKAKWCC